MKHCTAPKERSHHNQTPLQDGKYKESHKNIQKYVFMNLTKLQLNIIGLQLIGKLPTKLDLLTISCLGSTHKTKSDVGTKNRRQKPKMSIFDALKEIKEF